MSASSSQDEIPPPPPPPPSSQTPTQQTPHTVSTIKLPILKKGEYDIWAMKMEHYLAHTDYPIWEVIQNGNGPVSITTDTSGQIKVLPPRTAEEIVARERERKARTTLLMALPEDHLAKFHKMTDAKEMWDAIKSRFGGNDESKKMQKYILKQQFEGFSVSNTEGLHKGYDRFQSLLSQLEIHGAGVSTEDANQDYALMACNSSDSDTEVKEEENMRRMMMMKKIDGLNNEKGIIQRNEITMRFKCGDEASILFTRSFHATIPRAFSLVMKSDSDSWLRSCENNEIKASPGETDITCLNNLVKSIP
ncbi:hypothetical protein Tco_0914251 [Tanacetum coccineum]